MLDEGDNNGETRMTKTNYDDHGNGTAAADDEDDEYDDDDEG